MSAAESAPAPEAGTIPYLALGDSYTIGEGAAPAERWPVQLAALASVQGLPLAAPDIIARTGWTTAELLAAIEASGNQRTDYGLVSLLIGVNNQYRGQPVAQYRAELRELLARATRFAGGQPGRVLVLSIPDWGQAP
ncbi:MAG: SGNH/GDSL hydrolase family protein, partial [Hymenobacter sp.]